jgi:hypothetical protein
MIVFDGAATNDYQLKNFITHHLLVIPYNWYTNTLYQSENHSALAHFISGCGLTLQNKGSFSLSSFYSIMNYKVMWKQIFDFTGIMNE